MALYTIILDYDGGTYIDQVKSRSLKNVLILWATTLSENEVFGYKLGKQRKAELIEELKDRKPVALNGLQNAWCRSALIQDKLALINIVLTEQPKTKRKTLSAPNIISGSND